MNQTGRTDSERHNQITELFHRALDLSDERRAEFLVESCANDEELRQEVESLLALDERAADFIESPHWMKSFGVTRPGWNDEKSDARYCPQCRREFPSTERICPDDRHRLSLIDPYGLVGRVLAEKYALEALVGIGGMGAVYSAMHIGIARRTAFKILQPNVALSNDRLTGLFEREAKLAALLRHENIATVEDAGRTPEGYAYMAMEWVDGETLEAELAASGAFSLERAANILRQTAAGLEASHALSIIHCDLKPANLMLVRVSGGREGVKILDFGISKILEKAAGHPVSVAMGTPHYASPEQFEIGRLLDPRTDIYSLGVILYQMLSGDLPFQAKSVEDLSRQQRTSPALVNTLRPELPAQLGALINDMLAYDPKDRPKSIREILTRFSGKTAVQAPAKPISQRTPEPSMERPEVNAQLSAALRSAESGRGLLVCVTGEAGIGKTAVLDQFFRLASRSLRAGRLGRGRCREQADDAIPFFPILESIEELVRGSDLEKRLEQLAPTWLAQLIEMRSKPISRTEPQPGSRERMKRELRTFLQTTAREKPLILFLEDLHWADLSTIDALTFLGSKLESMRALIVASYRPSELALSGNPLIRVKLDLQTHGACQEIKLRPLNPGEIETHLVREFPGAVFPPTFLACLFENTEGNPMFLRALLTRLCDRRILREEAGHWRLVEEAPEVCAELTPAVEDLIRRKISRLGPEDLRLLAAAAALGVEFDSASLSTAVRESLDAVEERLETLDGLHGLVQLVSDANLSDRILSSRYRFVHRLYRTFLVARAV